MSSSSAVRTATSVVPSFTSYVLGPVNSGENIFVLIVVNFVLTLPPSGNSSSSDACTSYSVSATRSSTMNVSVSSITSWSCVLIQSPCGSLSRCRRYTVRASSSSQLAIVTETSASVSVIVEVITSTEDTAAFAASTGEAVVTSDGSPSPTRLVAIMRTPYSVPLSSPSIIAIRARGPTAL